MNNFTSIGKILNFHGIQGEAKVGFSQSQREILAKLKTAFVKTESEFIELKIKSVRFNKTFAIIKFDGIDSVDDILKFKGCPVFLEKGEIVNGLGKDEYLIEDLIGLNVFVEGTQAGVVTGVTNNGTNDFLAVKSRSDKVSLVPMVKAIVKNIDIKNRKVEISDIKGLIE